MNKDTVVVALYDFTAEQENHLSLCEGDKIRVLRQESSGWWNGVLLHDKTRSGWFPATYVEEIPTSDILPLQSAPPSPVLSPTSQHQPSSPCGQWVRYLTEDGQPYYVNSVTGESSWSAPSISPTIANFAPYSPPQTPVEDLLSSSFSRVDIGQSVASVDEETYGKPGRLLSSIRPSTESFSSAFKPKRLSSATTQSAATTDSASRAMAVTDNGKYGYSNNFWSDKGDKSGFDILVLKHRQGKEMCKDIVQMMAERAHIEECYAKSLLELAKTPLGTMESGTSKTAWNQLKFDIETQARSRLEFSKKTIKEVQQPLINFKNEQKKMRKNYEATIAADRKFLMLKYQNAVKMRRSYQTKAKDAEVADAMFAQGTTDVSKKEYQKLEDNSRRERKKASIAALDYKNSVEEYERIRLQWEDDMQTACYEFQQAEEERIDYTKVVLRKFMDIQKEVNLQCKESSEMAESSIDAVSKDVDIEMYVKSNFTGNQKPVPLLFEQYKQY